MKKYENYILCYVVENKAYFTRKNLREQWGDDWSYAPYEHNAGTPYTEDEDDLYEVYVEAGAKSSGLVAPRHFHDNSPYSVKNINSGIVPWLSFNRNNIDGSISTCHLYAGITLKEFVGKVREYEGKIFIPLE